MTIYFKCDHSKVYIYFFITTTYLLFYYFYNKIKEYSYEYSFTFEPFKRNRFMKRVIKIKQMQLAACKVFLVVFTTTYLLLYYYFLKPNAFSISISLKFTTLSWNFFINNTLTLDGTCGVAAPTLYIPNL